MSLEHNQRQDYLKVCLFSFPVNQYRVGNVNDPLRSVALSIHVVVKKVILD